MEGRKYTHFCQEGVMKKVLLLILAMLILGSGPALAQEKTTGRAQEHEKHHPAQPAHQKPSSR